MTDLSPVAPPARLTRDSVRASLAAVGMSFRKTDCSEWRVNFRGGAEATAYYASDLADALDTGLAMARRAAPAPVPPAPAPAPAPLPPLALDWRIEWWETEFVAPAPAPAPAAPPVPDPALDPAFHEAWSVLLARLAG